MRGEPIEVTRERENAGRPKIKVSQYKNGEFISTYKSIRDAAMAVNGQSTPISKACRGLQKHAYGFEWKIDQ